MLPAVSPVGPDGRPMSSNALQVSPARLAANRANAQRSTGPRTPEGKFASSRNATRHGLLAQQPLLDGEDPAEFEALRERLVEEFGPASAAEEFLVDDIAGLLWRLRRLAKVEVALLLRRHAHRRPAGSQRGR